MNTFNPVGFNREELDFLLENIGKAPVVAFRQPLSSDRRRKAVRPILQEVYDRILLEQEEGVKWAGVEVIKTTIRNWIREDAKNAENYRRSGGRIPRNPSLYVRDAKGKYHFGGSGSDSDLPRSFTNEKGERVPYEVSLDAPSSEEQWMDNFVVKQGPMALIKDVEKSRIECPICHHTESWKPDSHMSYNAARARMSRHLKDQRNKEVSLHMELYTMEFHS